MREAGGRAFQKLGSPGGKVYWALGVSGVLVRVGRLPI